MINDREKMRWVRSANKNRRSYGAGANPPQFMWHILSPHKHAAFCSRKVPVADVVVDAVQPGEAKCMLCESKAKVYGVPKEINDDKKI